MPDSVLSFSCVISATCHFCFLLASVALWWGFPGVREGVGEGGGGGYNQSLCRLVTGWIMQGTFLISAGLLYATQHDLSKALRCHLVCLGNESQFELVNSGSYLRKNGNIGWLRGKTLGVRQTWIWTSVLHLTGCVAYSQFFNCSELQFSHFLKWGGILNSQLPGLL